MQEIWASLILFNFCEIIFSHILELGIGPRNQLIKAPLMRLAAQEPNAVYATANLGEIYIPNEIKHKSFEFDGYLNKL